MSDVTQEVSTVDDVRQAILETERIVPVGCRTKPPLSNQPDHRPISIAGLAGIVEYEPSEFTFTAKAGTMVRDIIDSLAERGQYLPCDPMLVRGGATLGGTIAAGLSGPGRFRYGGLRDFILSAQLVVGNGDVVHTGGRVVKNAAGFDVPKFVIGSLGRLAVITEVTMKVFPKPQALQTICVPVNRHLDAISVMGQLARSTWELDAIDYVPSTQTVWLRLGGPAEASAAIASEIEGVVGEVRHIEPSIATAFWEGTTELNWTEADAWVKVPLTPDLVATLLNRIESLPIESRISVAGNVAWLAVVRGEALSQLDQALSESDLSGLMVRGDATSVGSPHLGTMPATEIASAIGHAFDPDEKFPTV